MREIKFKFWDSRLKKMLFRQPLTNDFTHNEIIPLQFTGILDSKGVEIYEGDIIQLKCKGYSFIENGTVVFENGAFNFKSSDGSIMFLHSIMKREGSSLEVIGNIHSS